MQSSQTLDEKPLAQRGFQQIYTKENDPFFGRKLMTELDIWGIEYHKSIIRNPEEYDPTRVVPILYINQDNPQDRELVLELTNLGLKAQLILLKDKDAEEFSFRGIPQLLAGEGCFPKEYIKWWMRIYGMNYCSVDRMDENLWKEFLSKNNPQ